jgi:DNA gyrase subunit A
LDNIDAVIQILRNAPDGTTAKLAFQDEFDFSDRQADAILAMPLRRLTGMERQNLNTEFAELTVKIADLEKLLGDRKELLKALKKDLKSLKKQFGDERRTRIIDAPAAAGAKRRRPPASYQRLEDPVPDNGRAEVVTIDVKASSVDLELTSPVEAPPSKPKQPGVIEFAPIAEVTRKVMSPKAVKALQLMAEERDGEATVLEFTADGIIRRMTPAAFAQDDRDVGDVVITRTEDTAIGQVLTLLTSSGRAFGIPVKSIPRLEQEAMGVEVVSLLPASVQGETVVTAFCLPTDLTDQFLILLSQQGRIKRLPATELLELGNRGAGLIKFKDDDALGFAGLANTGDQLVMATSTGRVLRLEVNDQLLPATNRSGAGVQAMRVLRTESLVGLAITGTADAVLFVSAAGYAKRMTTQAIKLSVPGELGTHLFQFTAKGDTVIGLTTAFPEELVVFITNEGNTAEFGVDDAPLASREHKGNQVLELNPEERIDRVCLPLLLAEG